MLKDMFHGLCMAMADSVPGVSGGSIAFLLGFYDKFITSLNNIISRDRNSGNFCYVQRASSVV